MNNFPAGNLGELIAFILISFGIYLLLSIFCIDVFPLFLQFIGGLLR